MKRFLAILLTANIISINYAYTATKQPKSTPAIDNEKLIESMYQNISGFGIGEQERTKIFNAGGNPTYGEITYQGAQKLIESIKIGPDDVFYDLGCGVGKLVMQFYLNTPIKKSCGIELSSSRIAGAQKARATLDAQGKIKKNRTLKFIEQSLLDADLSDATIIFICATCFSEELMGKIADKLSALPESTHIFTLKELPTTQFTLVETLNLPMTWSSSSAVYHYRPKRS